MDETEYLKSGVGKRLTIPGTGEIEKAIIVRQASAHEFGVSIADIQSSCREQWVCPARQISMFLTKKYTTLTLKQIGELYGNRNHSTVIASLETVENRSKTDRYFKQRVKDIENKVVGEIIAMENAEKEFYKNYFIK